MFDDFDDLLSMFNLVQVVNFVTWSRMVGLTLRLSILDHIKTEFGKKNDGGMIHLQILKFYHLHIHARS